MVGTIVNFIAVLVGTVAGCVIKGGIKEKYQEVLFAAMGLAALGIGLENAILNMPRSNYPVLFIVTWLLVPFLGPGGGSMNIITTLSNAVAVIPSLPRGLLPHCSCTASAPCQLSVR